MRRRSVFHLFEGNSAQISMVPTGSNAVMTRACAALLFLLTTSTAVADDQRPLQVFVLAGTSNMHGRNANPQDLPEGLRQPQPNILVHEKGEWTPLAAGKNLVGNEATFGEAMTRHLGEPIGIIRIGVGSASERPKGTSINNIVKQSRAAGRPVVIAGMLLDVSFRDGIQQEKAQGYAENLPRWIAAFREEIGVAQLPIAMNRAIPPVPKTPYLDQVRKAQDEARLPHFRLFHCDDVARGGDNIHFNTAGRLEMGRRFAAAMIELMKPSPSEK